MLTVHFTKSLMGRLVLIIALGLGVGACSNGSEEPQKRQARDNNAAVASPSPVIASETTPAASPSTDPQATASPSSSTACEDQWLKHVAAFKVGAKLTYTSSIKSPSHLIRSQGIALQHTEEIITSDETKIERLVTVTSTDLVVGSLLGLMKIPPKATESKSLFVSACQKASDNAASTITFSGGDLQILESRDDVITLNGQQKDVRYMKLKANVTGTLGSAVTANLQVWLSKESPGLVLKQIAELSGLPMVMTATITDELASATGM